MKEKPVKEKRMKKTCSRAIATSRADSGRTMSRRFATRNSPFDAAGKAGERPVDPEWPEDLFLMNRFYGKAVLEPLIRVLREDVAGEKSGLLAETLEKEMQAKKGCIRGDALWEILKNGLGMACAVHLIAGLDGFGGLGLYDDRIMARFAQGRKRPAQTATSCCGKSGGMESPGREKIREATRGCRDRASGKEENRWRGKREKN